jgi:hypothetical protein
VTTALPEKGTGKSAASAWSIGRAAFRYTKPATVISIVALVLSLVNFHVTTNQQAILTVYAGCNWLYGRGVSGLGTDVEYFVAPITVVNDGARTGTVLEIDLVVETGSSSKSFPANFIATSFDDKALQISKMFSPIAVAGHASTTDSIIFTQSDPRDPPLFGKAVSGEAVSFPATIKSRPAVPFSDRLIDRWFSGPGPEPHFPRIAPVYEGKTARFNVC